MSDTIIRVRGGAGAIGTLDGQSTQLSDNSNPTQLTQDVVDNINFSRASASTELPDNNLYLGNAETFNQSFTSVAAAAGGVYNAAKLAQTLQETTTGFGLASIAVSGLGTVAGVAAAFIPGVAVAGLIAATVSAPISGLLSKTDKIVVANREAKLISNQRSARINKR